MNIELSNISKRYNHHWIIKNFNQVFGSQQIYGIQGRNGTGKSTLLKIISGFLLPSKGEVKYSQDSKNIHHNDIYQYISYAAPYIKLDDVLTPTEIFDHVKKFKKYKLDNIVDLMEIAMLPNQQDKVLSQFSSGMYQRFQLSLAILNDNPILLLDEPTSYLDQQSKDWFISILDKNKKDKTIIIASNDTFDFQNSSKIIEL